MSFDLAVWHSDSPLSEHEAQQIYIKLCENWPYLEGANPNVDAFYRELIQKWPEIDTIPEERIDDSDDCPWSCAVGHSGMAVVMSCVWSKAEEVSKQVMTLAEIHHLVFFNPQTNQVILPADLQTAKKPWFRRLFS